MSTRSIEKSIVQIEKAEQAVRMKVIGIEEMNRSALSKAAVPLQCGKPLSFGDQSLSTIEAGAMVKRGTGSALQLALNTYEDDFVNNVLSSIPRQATIDLDLEFFK